MSEQEDEKKKLMDLLAQAPATAGRMSDAAEKIHRTAHFVQEMASAELDLLNALPSGALPRDELTRKVATWQSWTDNTPGQINQVIALSDNFASTSLAAVTTSANTVYSMIAVGVAQTTDVRMKIR